MNKQFHSHAFPNKSKIKNKDNQIGSMINIALYTKHTNSNVVLRAFISEMIHTIICLSFWLYSNMKMYVVITNKNVVKNHVLYSITMGNIKQ